MFRYPSIFWIELALTALLLYGCSSELEEDFVQSAKAGDLERVSLLLAKEVDIEVRDKKHGASALMWAAHEGHIEVLKLLAKNGADINARQKQRRSALWYAAQQGRIKVVRWLADQGADLNATSSDGVTSVMVAKQQGFPEIAELLIAAGAAN